MARSQCFSVLVLLFALYMTGEAASTSTKNQSPKAYIVASCKATRYPALCVECLSGYASTIHRNEHHLAKTALSVGLSKTQSAAVFVSKMNQARDIKPREYQAVRDCLENLVRGGERLSQSFKELSHIERATGKEFIWHISNIQTWVSAALTDQNTCLEGFAGRVLDGNIKSAVNHRVVNVMQITSNALALINRYAVRHRADSPTKKP